MKKRGGGCEGDDKESGSPVSYLTGHKVERVSDLSVALPGRDFRLVREYTSDPNFYSKDSSDNYYWNSGFTQIIPGLAGVNWTFNTVSQYVRAGDSANAEEVFVHGGQMRSVSRYEYYQTVGGEKIFVSVGNGNATIETGTHSSVIAWLDAAGATEDGANVPVWILRAPGGGEKVFLRFEESGTQIANQLDRTDLAGLLLYERDAYGNTFEYVWKTLGTGSSGREIVRLDQVIASSVGGGDHAVIEFDWHGESGTGLDSASTSIVSDPWLYGRIDEVRVRRPLSGGGWSSPTQRVRYVHFDEIKDIEAQDVLGVGLADPNDKLRDFYDAEDGDLCEVIVSKLVDEGGDADGMHHTVTQYRYYSTNNNFGQLISDETMNSAVSELNGFVSAGERHQLMAVIYPQQIEYYASSVFNEFTALGSNTGDIAAALDINTSQVSGFQSDVYTSGQAFATVIDAAERLRWVNFQDGTGDYEFSQALLLPNKNWSSLFDLAGKFVSYYTSSSGLYGEEHRVRTQLVSSGANGCGCGGGGMLIGLGKRYDYMYRRYELAQDYPRPASVDDRFNIISDGYSCLIAESYLSLNGSTLEYVPYRVHCHDYYWPTSLPNGYLVAPVGWEGSAEISGQGVRRIARALCTADQSWGTGTNAFDPFGDPIDHTGPNWAATRVYGYDDVDPSATQFNNFGKLTAALTPEAVAASGSGYIAVADSGEDTLSGSYPQTSNSGRVFTYDYDGGYLTTVSVKDGTESVNAEVLTQKTLGSSGDRPDVVTQEVRDAGDGVVETSSMDYGYHSTANINAAIIAWTKSEMTPESPAQNGPASPGSIDYAHWSLFDELGQLRWDRDPDGTLTYYEYDLHTGKTTRVTRDMDPSDSGLPSDVLINDTNFPGLSSAGWSLPTRTSYDQLTDTYEYDTLGRQTKSTDAAGVSRYMRRVVMGPGSSIDSNYVREYDLGLGNIVGLVTEYGVGLYANLDFPHRLGDGSFDGPISVSWQDAAGTSLRQSSFACQSGGSGYNPVIGEYGIGAEYARSDSELAVTGATLRSRQWFDVTQTVNADLGSFFSETRYDGVGRTYQVIDPLGGVTQYGTSLVPGYDIMDKPLAMAQGVIDSGGMIDVELISETFYDSDHTETQGIGNGLVSVTKQYTGEGSEARVTKYWYDYRDRLIGQLNPVAPHQVFGYDILGRQVEQATWINSADFVTGASGSVPAPSDYDADRSTYSKSFYNNRGMVYRQIQAIDPTMDPLDLSYPGYLETLTWYDPEGMAVATWSPSSPASKTLYDHLDRPLKSYVTNRKNDGLWGSGSYEQVFDSSGTQVDVSDDQVLAQTEYRYIAGGNPGAGQADLVTSRVRLHNTSVQGDLGSANSIAMFSMSNFDDASRVIDSLSYGTNDTTTNKFKSGTSAPSSIDTDRSTSPALITSVRFDAIGRSRIQIDPEGKETLTMYDDLSRSVAMVENRTGSFDEDDISWNGSKWSVNWGSGGTPPADENRVTSFVYDNNSNVILRTAHINTGDVQETAYEYGVSATSGSGTMESRIDSPSMLAEVHYPNESTGLADSSAAYTVSYAYNRLGEMRGMTNQNGIEHAYTRDAGGRVISNKVSFPGGTAIDDSVAEITTTFDTHGRVLGVYSWDGSSTPVELNSVEYEYTPLHQLEAIVQNVDVDGGANDERVEYDYVNAVPGASGGNYSRLDAVRYPSQAAGTTSSYELDYGTAGSLNDLISRVNGIDVPNWAAPDDELVRYVYAGTGLPVRVNYTAGSIRLDATKDHEGVSTSGTYPAFDRFGRTVWHAWVHNNYSTGPNANMPNASPLVARRYSYNETTKLRDRDWDGRPGVVLSDRDWEYDYDGLDRLTEASRGLWDASTMTFGQSEDSRQWDLDMLGNWNAVITDLDGDGLFEAGDETEDRGFNLANEMNSREGPVGTGITFAPQYDNAGNFVSNNATGSSDLEYTYDAWNRLVRVEKVLSGGARTTVLENEYNGLGWRVVRRMDTSDGAYDGLDERRHYYFTPSWQMIEEHVDSNNDGDFADAGDFKSQQFWGTRYIDDAVAKRIDRDNDGDWEEAGDQYYYLTDAMYSVRAVASSAGYVRERIDYTPYGRAMHRYAGDYNGDGQIDLSDITILNSQGSKKPGDAGYNPHVDLNGDGSINGFDTSVFSADYNFVSTNANGVPPSGWLSDHARTSVDGTDNQYGFDGYWFDVAGATDGGSTGLYCVRNRVYDSGMGRWLTRDPAGFADGTGLFEFTSSNPVAYTDSAGLWKIDLSIGDFSAVMGPDGSANAVPYASSIELRFNHKREKFAPGAGHCCTEIRFIQIHIPKDDLRSSSYNSCPGDGSRWCLDNVGSDIRNPFYPYGAWNNPSISAFPSQMNDSPRAAMAINRRTSSYLHEFEVCAVCSKGIDAKDVYGCMTWGHDMRYRASGLYFPDYEGWHVRRWINGVSRTDGASLTVNNARSKYPSHAWLAKHLFWEP